MLTTLVLLSFYISNYVNPCYVFNDLQTQIREGQIEKQEAKIQFKAIIPQLKQYFTDNGGIEIPRENWIFPLQDYNHLAIGGHGNGYLAKGYDYFDGNKSHAHPAHDIFIRDADQDDTDDKTGTLVNVRSMSCGVVVAVVNDWQPESELRGGKSVMIYDPVSNGLFAYAHHSFVFSGVGDIIKPGDVIGTVGRTGKNAYAPKSPTHLHISYMKIGTDTLPRPENIYTDLVRAGKNSR